MNTDWNELAQAYDEKCEMLEKARTVYSQAIDGILTSLANEISRSCVSEFQSGALSHDLSIQPGEDVVPLLRKVLKYDIPGPGGGTIMSLLVRFSSPWGQGAGFLQIGIVAQAPKWVGTLHQRIQADPWVAARTQVQSNSENWIYGEALRLSEPKLIRRVSDLLQDMFGLCKRSVEDLVRVDRLLLACSRELKGDELLMSEFPDLLQKVADWGKPTYRYIHLNRQNPYWGFWLGHEGDRRTLMFGYNGETRSVESKLLAALKQEVGAEQWEEYSPGTQEAEPGGTLMSAARLANASDEEILKTMIRAFRTYARIARKAT